MMARLAQRLRRDDGQVMALLAAGMFVALLGIAGLVIDVGHAYQMKRKLQATADAAATAAAYDLPSVTTALTTATTYGSGPTGFNAVPGGGVTQTASAWCLKSIAYCYGATPGSAVATTATAQANGIVVKEQAQVKTTFLKLFGKSSFTISASAVACGICGATKLDVALVVDRTQSMDGSLASLTSGIEAFLTALNPDLDEVSLLVLPPGPACSSPLGSSDMPFDAFSFWTYSFPLYAYSSSFTNRYLAVPLTSDFQNPSSGVYNAVSCLSIGGPTSYKGALAAAYAELQTDGRSDAQKVIVFESDGAANDAEETAYDQSTSKTVNGQTYYAPLSTATADVKTPCQAAVNYANSIKSSSLTIYTVGYGIEDSGGDHTCYASPFYDKPNGRVVGYRDPSYAESSSAATYLQQIASKPADAFDATKSNSAAIVQSFQQIATKLQGASLVPPTEAPGS